MQLISGFEVVDLEGGGDRIAIGIIGAGHGVTQLRLTTP